MDQGSGVAWETGGLVMAISHLVHTCTSAELYMALNSNNIM